MSIIETDTHEVPMATMSPFDPTTTVELLDRLTRPEIDCGLPALETRLIQLAHDRAGRADHLRRAFDIVVASVSLVVSLPLLVATALAIHFTSPGPIFFHQSRVGRRGTLFECLKFRTMVCDADEQLNALLLDDAAACAAFETDFKLTDDPRITHVGRLLRRASLDELPQLVNVLRGEMSIVGPRPVVPEELRRYGDYGQVVVQVRPGMTGPWQVGGRNSISYRQRVLLDLDYALHRTMATDVDIVRRTVRCVLRPIEGTVR